MAFRSLLSAPLSSYVLAAVLMATGIVRAEDPFLGIIREIKCVNCKPGWVTLLINDPIETRDFELYLKDSDYNKIITPLPGKSIHEKNGECFYWIEKPRTPKAKASPAEGAAAHGASAPADAASGKSGAKKPAAKGAPGTAGKQAADSMGAAAASDSSPALPPPAPESQGKESSCIRFYRQMN